MPEADTLSPIVLSTDTAAMLAMFTLVLNTYTLSTIYYITSYAHSVCQLNSLLYSRYIFHKCRKLVVLIYLHRYLKNRCPVRLNSLQVVES